MNHFGISVTELAGDAPLGPVIPARQFVQYVSETARLGAARRRSAQALWRARRLLVHARQEARARAVAQADALLREASAAAARIAHDARLEGLNQTVAWLVEESQLEQIVAAGLEGRCRELVCAALRAYAAEMPADQLIANHVVDRLGEIGSHGRLNLRVSPPLRDAVARRVAQHIAQSTRPEIKLQVVADASLNEKLAVLDSPYVQVRVDLDAHLQALLSQLAGKPEGKEARDDGDR